MNRNWDKSFDLVIVNEGEFVNNLKDPGGATNWGCTQAVWEKYVGHSVTVDDMKALTKEDVKPLYKRNYWDALHGDAILRDLTIAFLIVASIVVWVVQPNLSKRLWVLFLMGLLEITLLLL